MINAFNCFIGSIFIAFKELNYVLFTSGIKHNMSEQIVFFERLFIVMDVDPWIRQDLIPTSGTKYNNPWRKFTPSFTNKTERSLKTGWKLGFSLLDPGKKRNGDKWKFTSNTFSWLNPATELCHHMMPQSCISSYYPIYTLRSNSKQRRIENGEYTDVCFDWLLSQEIV